MSPVVTGQHCWVALIPEVWPEFWGSKGPWNVWIDHVLQVPGQDFDDFAVTAAYEWVLPMSKSGWKLWEHELNEDLEVEFLQVFLTESEAWKGLRTAVTSLAPAGRGVWGPGTQKPQGTFAFVRFHLAPYHSKKQETLDLWNSRHRWAASLYISRWITDPHLCLSLMSISRF